MRRAMFKTAVLTGAAASAMALTACVSLLPEPQPTTLYRLTSAAGEEGRARAPRGAPVIRINRPVMSRALALDRLALSTGEGRIAYMSQVNWVSPAPVLIQELMLDTFDRQAAQVSAARPDDAVTARWDLRTEVRRFEAVYDRGEDAAPRVDIYMRARLIDTENRGVTAVRSFETSRRAAANRQGQIVDAFSQAASEAVKELTAWAETEIAEFDPDSIVERRWERGQWRRGADDTPPDQLPRPQDVEPDGVEDED